MKPPDRHNQLLERVKRILETVLDKFDEAERERQIIALLKSIEEKLDALGGGTSDAEIVALLESTFRPRIERLNGIAEPPVPSIEPLP